VGSPVAEGAGEFSLLRYLLFGSQTVYHIPSFKTRICRHIPEWIAKSSISHFSPKDLELPISE